MNTLLLQRIDHLLGTRLAGRVQSTPQTAAQPSYAAPSSKTPGSGTVSQASSSQTTLGPAAQTILALFKAQPDTTATSLRRPLLPLAALLTDSSVRSSGVNTQNRTINSQLLAPALQNALQTSGLFYESHLHQATLGQKPLAALQAEPQAQLPSAPQSTGTPASPAATESTNTVNTRPTPSAPLPAGLSSAPAPDLHPDSLSFVRQQLDILATDTVMLRGFAWDNTPFEWLVKREQQDQTADDTTPLPSRWSSDIAIQLAKLGTVSARISVSGNRISMHIVSEKSADTLTKAGPHLHGQLLQAGLKIDAFSVAEGAPHIPSEAALADNRPGDEPEP